MMIEILDNCGGNDDDYATEELREEEEEQEEEQEQEEQEEEQEQEEEDNARMDSGFMNESKENGQHSVDMDEDRPIVNQRITKKAKFYMNTNIRKTKRWNNCRPYLNY